MGKRGPRGQSPDQQKSAGETRPSRKVVNLFASVADRPDPEDMSPPATMSKEAQDIWREKVERYRQRGQKVDGFQSALRQYCELEAALIKAWGYPMGPPVAMINSYRSYCAEFYDTPASHRVKLGDGKSGGATGNRFGNNGQR